MIKKLFLISAALLALGCSRTRFVPSDNYRSLAKNELGVYLFLPQEDLPQGSVEMGEWEYSNSNGKTDVVLLNRLKIDAQRKGCNIIRLDRVKRTFGGEKLNATFFYHEDLAAIRYHLIQKENKDSLKNCQCALLHFFRFAKKLNPNIKNGLKVYMEDKEIGNLKQRDYFSIRVPLSEKLNLRIDNSDTLSLSLKEGEEYLIELFEPSRSSIYFTGKGVGISVYMGEAGLRERSGLLNRLRFEHYLKNKEAAQ